MFRSQMCAIFEIFLVATYAAKLDVPVIPGRTKQTNEAEHSPCSECSQREISDLDEYWYRQRVHRRKEYVRQQFANRIEPVRSSNVANNSSTGNLAIPESVYTLQRIISKNEKRHEEPKPQRIFIQAEKGSVLCNHTHFPSIANSTGNNVCIDFVMGEAVTSADVIGATLWLHRRQFKKSVDSIYIYQSFAKHPVKKEIVKASDDWYKVEVLKLTKKWFSGRNGSKHVILMINSNFINSNLVAKKSTRPLMQFVAASKAMVKAAESRKGVRSNFPSACCTPLTYSNLDIFVAKDGAIIADQIRNIIVESCGCI